MLYFLSSCESVNVCLTPLHSNTILLGLQFLDRTFFLQKLTYAVPFSPCILMLLYRNMKLALFISLLSKKKIFVSSFQMPNKFFHFFFFLMFSNLPASILVVLILSQISYNMVYLECAFNYGDLVLPSCKGSSPHPLYLSFILCHYVVSLLQGYQLAFVYCHH